MDKDYEVTLPVTDPETGETEEKTFKLKDITSGLHEVDLVPTLGSHNVVESGGVYEAIKEKSTIPVNPIYPPTDDGSMWITTK